MKNIQKTVYMIVASIAICAGSAMAQAPNIFFTDIISGPSTGGENGNGAYVTVYGSNFGSSPSATAGGAAAAIKLGPAAYLWYQKLVIQISSTAAQGAGSITVTNSSGSDSVPFTIRTGKIYSVAGGGSDSNSGAFGSPWATITHARDAMSAGSIVYVNGVNQTKDDGQGWGADLSLAIRGTAGNPIAFVVYPGATSQIGALGGEGIKVAPGSNQTSSYLVFAGFTIRGSANAFSMDSSMALSTDYRFVGNDFSCSTQSGQSGCFHNGAVSNIVFQGNVMHDAASGQGAANKQSHSIYFSSNVNHVDMGWNSVHDNNTCYGVQFHSSPVGNANGANQFDLQVHDNLFYNQTCSAINFASVDPSQAGGVNAWNNVMYHVGYQPASDGGATTCINSPNLIASGASKAASGDIKVFNNTFYDCGDGATEVSQGSEGFGSNNTHIAFTNNIVQQINSEVYFSTGQINSMVSGSNNLWFGRGNGPSQTSGNINADPLFANLSSKDFHLQSSSPAIGAGVAMSGLTADITGAIRPGTSPDLGAYEVAVSAPDLSVTSAHSGNFSQGDIGDTYMLAVSNVGSQPTTLTVTVADTLPTGLTATAISGSGWTCTAPPVLSCTRSNALSGGASYPAITLTVNVSNSASGSVTNIATVAGGGELNIANDTATDPTTIAVPATPADLTVTKSHTGNFTQGQTGATYTITVSNGGGTATSGTVTMVDTLPAGLTATAISGTGWTCVVGTATCTRTTALAAGASYPAITVTVSVASNAASSVTNTATVSGGGETNTANDTASDATTINAAAAPADLTVTKSHTGNFTQGQTGATYTITVSNGGGTATSGTVTMMDTLPAGLTATAISGTGWTCVVGTATCTRTTALAAGASYPAITVTVSVASNAASSVTNTATVSGGGETNTANDTASDATTINAAAAPADLTVTKSHTGNFTQGQTGATYTITVSNGGGTATSGTVTMVDTLPAGLTATAISGTGWTCVVGTATCTRTTALAAGASYPAITVTVSVASNAASSVTNTATVSGGGETNTANDTASDATTINAAAAPADLTVTKSHTGNFTQGQTGATYTITVSNGGGTATSGTVTMMDTLPAGLTATAISGTGWTCVVGTATCTRTTALAAGASYPAITVTVSVASNAASSVTNTATVSGGGETNTANDTATNPTTIVAPADLTITAGHTGNFTQGQTGATYTITVTNSGNGPTTGTVTATDALPSGLTAVALSGTGWSCVLNSLSCVRSDALAAGTSYPAITATVNVAANAAASVTNTATVSGGGETNTANDTASNPTTINALSLPADLTVNAAHSGNFVQGQTGAIYTITVTNSGQGATSGTVTAIDTLPSGLTATAISGTGWTCVLGTLTCTRSTVLAGGASYPAISVTVNVAVNAAASVTNTATVSGGGETNTANDTASNPTTINAAASPADLAVTKTHTGNFTQGQSGATYTITVSNGGGSSTSGTITMVDTLPSGLTATAINGGGWSCVLATLTCTRTDALGSGASYPAITVTVNVSANAAASVTNVATISGGGAGNPANDTASDITTIQSSSGGSGSGSSGSGSSGGSGGSSGGGGGAGNSGSAILVSPSSLNFVAYPSGASPAPQAFSVSGSGGAAWYATVVSSTGGNWLELSPPSGVGDGSVVAIVSGFPTEQGTYTATVQVGTLGSGTGASVVSITLTVNAPPMMAIGASGLSFATNVGVNPDSKQVTVSTSIDPQSWTAAAQTDSGGNWLVVTPSSGTTPATATISVDASNLAQGNYTGSIIFTSPNAGSQTLPVQLAVASPLVSNGGIVNAASFGGNGAITQGSIVSLFGDNLASSTVSAASVAQTYSTQSNGGSRISTQGNPLPSNLGGTQVFVNGVQAPLFFVSRNQINLQVPYEISGATASVVVVVGGLRSLPMNLPIASDTVGIFTASSTGNGQGSILNSDSSPNSGANPAPAGSVVSIYCTGLGAVTPALPSGQPGGFDQDLNMTVVQPTVMIGGTQAQVLFSGVAPGFVGLYQVNVVVPAGTPAGSSVPLQIQAGGQSSNMVTLAVN